VPPQLTTTFTGLRFENPFLRDHALHHLQHRRDELVRCSQQHAQRDRQRQHPLRTGTCGMTWSTKCAAVCDIRRAPHGGQHPRRLQLKASSLSWPHSPQRSLRKSWARMPRSRKASNSSLMNRGSSAPVLASVWAMKLAACCCTRR